MIFFSGTSTIPPLGFLVQPALVFLDECSRLAMASTCDLVLRITNNRALTVYKLFKNATQEFGVPSRVRSDKGGENVLVCQFMIAARGTGRVSHNAGSWVHNQRIERLWQDVYRPFRSRTA